jgi:hypothetical protein
MSFSAKPGLGFKFVSIPLRGTDVESTFVPAYDLVDYWAVSIPLRGTDVERLSLHFSRYSVLW